MLFGVSDRHIFFDFSNCCPNINRASIARLIVVTLNRQSSERIVAGGESSVGEDGGVDPGQEVGDAGVYVRNILWKGYLNKNLCWLFLTLI